MFKEKRFQFRLKVLRSVRRWMSKGTAQCFIVSSGDKIFINNLWKCEKKISLKNDEKFQ